MNSEVKWRPPIGTDEYRVWFQLQGLKHLMGYLDIVTDPDLHEDLRESDPDGAIAALRRLAARAFKGAA